MQRECRRPPSAGGRDQLLHRHRAHQAPRRRQARVRAAAVHARPRGPGAAACYSAAHVRPKNEYPVIMRRFRTWTLREELPTGFLDLLLLTGNPGRCYQSLTCHSVDHARDRLTVFPSPLSPGPEHRRHTVALLQAAVPAAAPEAHARAAEPVKVLAAAARPEVRVGLSRYKGGC
jgi:hypothetical protein